MWVLIRHISNKRKDHFTFAKRIRFVQKSLAELIATSYCFEGIKRGKCVQDLVMVFVSVSCENALMAVVSVLLGLTKTF